MGIAVSLIATVKDEGASMPRFLSALLRQTRLPDEIVLVDGGSRDGTVARAREIAADAPIEIRVIEAPGTNISQGRNIAIADAAGEVIAVTDAGTEPRPDWLERLIEPVEADNAVSVSSGFYLPGGHSFEARCIARVITPQLPEVDPKTFLPSSRSVAFRKRAWEEVGGYPEWLSHCEDLVFDVALRSAGAGFRFAPEAIVTWDARPDLRSFARQYFNYARGDAHANLWPGRHLIRYASYAIGSWLALRTSRRPRSSVFLLGAGGAAYLSKFVRRLRRIPVSDNRGEQIGSYVLMPLIVVVGDVAKMVGYAVGLTERVGGPDDRPR